MSSTLKQELAQIVGGAQVADDEHSLDVFHADIWTRGEAPHLIVVPANPDERAREVVVATRNKSPVVPRGGGNSYTVSYIGGDYTRHAAVERQSKAAVNDRMTRLRAVAKRHDGKEIENTISTPIRANQFTLLNNILEPEDECGGPINGMAPILEGPKMWAKIDDYEVSTEYLVTTMGATGYLIEPWLFGPEEPSAIHCAMIDHHMPRRMRCHSENEVVTVHERILDCFERAGVKQFQVGRTNRCALSYGPAPPAMLRAMKAAHNPAYMMKPGVLGL